MKTENQSLSSVLMNLFEMFQPLFGQNRAVFFCLEQTELVNQCKPDANKLETNGDQPGGNGTPAPSTEQKLYH